LVQEALEEHGVHGELIVLTDGESAIQFIRSLDAQGVECPDLVILDLNLPKKPGREVLECMRQSVTCSLVPVVILSSSDAAVDRAETTRLGASRYIRKPSRLDEFMSLGAIFKAMLGDAPE
jgi:DNA-binding response OmpR family regulator